MDYLIARDREGHGCIALKIKYGKHLVELKRRLNQAVGYKGIELITASRPTAYGEVCAISVYRHRAGVWKD